MKDSTIRFKVGDRVKFKIRSIFFNADCGYILRIENSGHRYYRTNNRWNYVVSNIDPTVYAEMCDVWEMDLFKSDLQLDQEWHNEQQMKKLLGVK